MDNPIVFIFIKHFNWRKWVYIPMGAFFFLKRHTLYQKLLKKLLKTHNKEILINDVQNIYTTFFNT